MAHSADRGSAVFLKGLGANSTGGMEPGCCTKNPAMSFPGILYDVDKERGIAAMPADQIETVEAARHKDVDHSQPKVLKSTPTGIHRRRERGAVCADPIR